ncbi:MAG: 2Fe-2S iron-sulfur cluster-binding protein [Luminiphilus sp.]|jgi:2Fe-2S ferredoxin|nr:2Fe-2S iron-sulfur cluster-binding protein [Luminiphilus sp.]|tara:strand:+ start:479 stop:808 length:330 start_codon:yes stop_codon:yes gene_type:complete
MSEPISVHVTTREGEQRTVTQGAGHQTLMQVLYDEDIGVEAVCGGCTSCATCHVLIEPEWMGKLPERDQAELMLLQYAEYYDPDRSRLSCQLDLNSELDGMPLTIAPEE